MSRKLTLFLFFVLLAWLPSTSREAVPSAGEFAPVPASVPPAALSIPVARAVGPTDYPVRLLIPAISLDSRILGVGVNSLGAMDVPSGQTNEVGWYKEGTLPGDLGSSVLDAHVFAAFANLKEVDKGNDIYVLTQSGAKLRFRVYSIQKYPIAAVPLEELFNKGGDRYLNLITCAGKLTADRSTYDQRLIVYSKLGRD